MTKKLTKSRMLSSYNSYLDLYGRYLGTDNILAWVFYGHVFGIGECLGYDNLTIKSDINDRRLGLGFSPL